MGAQSLSVYRKVTYVHHTLAVMVFRYAAQGKWWYRDEFVIVT